MSQILSPTSGPPIKYRLYSVGAVDLATVVGSILAGAILLHLNQRAVGDSEASRPPIYVGVLGLALILAAAWFEPETWQLPDALYQGAQVLGIHLYAKHTQGQSLERHEQDGGEFHSKWRAAGVGLVVAAVLGAILFAPVFFSLDPAAA